MKGFLLAIILSVIAIPVMADNPWAPDNSPALNASLSPKVITNDQGGFLKRRVNRVHELWLEGREVRIQGKCYSACTLYLNLDHVCISRDARIGFHGPSYYGIVPANDAEGDEWRKIMASYYPEPIANWYFETGAANKWFGFSYIRGDYFIDQLGYEECGPKS